ncbi:hypothetical protein DH2020_044032 [Rehmannia glutinosa]|uniref:RNase H type-1 domain-containing protein n=1 Tax=Rehmannia glutinosa TaxID=99300 RepID=A0ABR0UI10_REHGL
MAAMLSIHYAFVKGWTKLWLKSDSAYVVNLIHKRSSDVPWRHLSNWRYTLHLISQMDLVVSHIYREGNRVADFLSKNLPLCGTQQMRHGFIECLRHMPIDGTMTWLAT